ncbi:NUDIX domain-containing protein [Quadrisphaera granulorum]|uniref:NUDIX domain-containing protein n=1 Tax=Quadrisphaera granulorum TaxID=317664 RepID=A0A315ZTW2_9ACTN|nr:NUDIX hydrolase [Quadrisphaera granulorum]PWJ48328.1 NUDIX domain-containing protein [Quadrisphaera granulorum]SZE98489.1 NUDIX domain-containing protein [Quadrisphaera granulorum]
MEPLESRVVYANPWISVREDLVRREDGSTGVYGVVDKPDFCIVLPRTTADDGPGEGWWLVEQYRYPVRARRWEFPQGTWPSGASGSLEDLARAELAEETGLRAARLTLLGSFDLAAGMASQRGHAWLAEGLTPGEQHLEETEADLITRWVSRQEFAAMVTGGRLVDAVSLAALSLLAAYEGG